MTTGNRGEQGRVWPPAVCVERPQPAPDGQGWWGRAALLLGSLVWGCWAVAFLALSLWYQYQANAQSQASPVLLPDPPWLILSGNVALYAGPALALLGLWPGTTALRMRSGRIGLALSVLGLVVMGGVLAYGRHALGHWPWLTSETPKDPCGCR